MKKVIKNFLFIVLAVIILIVGGCFVILGIIDQQNKNYWILGIFKGEEVGKVGHF